MSCFNCTKQAIEENERKNNLVKECEELANKTGEWYGIYIDEQGKEQISKYEPGKYIFKSIVSPKL